MSSEKANAANKGGAQSNRAGGPETTKVVTGHGQCSTDSDVLTSRSTSTAAQLAKTLALLRLGDKTTVELRQHGIMMPAARVYQLKHECNHTITAERVTLYDADGYRHGNCARYHLVADASTAVSP